MTPEVKNFFQSYSWKDFPDCDPITKEFIDRNDRLHHWISAWPDEKQLLQRAHKRVFLQETRELLVETISKQYRDSGLYDQIPANLNALLDPNTYTICTGHQLCLLGGPAFIWFKLTQLCSLARSVNENQNEFHIVPVFWLASEDHDIAEISNISMDGNNYTWSTNDLGATGRLSTKGIDKIIEELQLSFPELMHSKTIEWIRDSYSCDYLAGAWRRLIHGLAGHLGIVVMDGNHRSFKAQFSEIMAREIDQGFMFHSMQKQLHEFKNYGFDIPVNPRECCLFYLQSGLRSRIVRNANDTFQTVDGLRTWTREEILNEASVNPENFSPNVLMRPLYQECILPNLLYLAGPSELNYWLQLKPCFDEVKMDFPLLHLRSGITLISQKTQKLLLKSKLTLPELMENSDVILNRLMRKNNRFLADDLRMIEEKWSDIIAKAKDADTTLKAAAEAELQRVRMGIQRLEAKMIKAEKRKNSELAIAISQLKGVLFPGGKYQERNEGIIHLLPVENGLLERMMEHMNPWISEMILMKWETGSTLT